MATVQVRIEGNALTTPPSYSVRFVPKDTLGYDELAAEVVQMHPNYAQEDAKTIIMAAMQRIGANLINGNQTVLPDAFTFSLSFSARLESPDDPLPPVADMLNVRVHASKSCTETVQRAVQIERLPMTEKAPVISAAEDTVLGLKDILHSGGAVRLTGSNLLFDPKKADEACVIEGTRSGRTVQTRFVGIANTEVTLLPDIPAQNDPWNNEYILSIATHYTANGTLRTGTYRRKLRTPLTVTIPESYRTCRAFSDFWNACSACAPCLDSQRHRQKKWPGLSCRTMERHLPPVNCSICKKNSVFFKE